MARWAPRDGLGLEGQRDRHGDSARLPPEGPIVDVRIQTHGRRDCHLRKPDSPLTTPRGHFAGN